MSAANLLDRLDKVRRTGDGRWIACCPAHEDRTPSLSIRETDDGTVLVHCFSGCGAADVLGAVGMNLAALFPDRPGDHRRKARRGQRHVPADVLACIARDAVLVMIAAEDVRQGKALSDDDADKLSRASERLRRAAREGGANV